MEPITGEKDKFTLETLDDAFFIDKRDDLAFSINERLIIFCEMQSTVNPNIPMRLLSYMTRTYERLIKARRLYGTTLQQVPAPEFYLLYIGTRSWGVQQLRLSDAYLEKPHENSAELVVNVLNLGYNNLYQKPEKARSEDEKKLLEILERSPAVKGYYLLNAYIREGTGEGRTLEDSINTAIARCFDEGLLIEFLKAERKEEVSGMMFRRLTMEEYGDICAENAFEQGEQKGRAAGAEENLLNNIRTLMETLSLSAEQAMDALKVSPEQRKCLLAKLN